MKAEIFVRFIVTNPPAGEDFGIQDGKGSRYETVGVQRSTGEDIELDFSLQVDGGRPDGGPNFVGPMAQGSPQARFVYIDIAKAAGQDVEEGRRIKVPLESVTWEMVAGASTTEGNRRLTATIPGDASATVHPQGGWRLVRREDA